ncbi:MAG TPA: sigma-54 dependent transcriptional regulator [Blastocatellia bacterium]|jgi:two-component system response regulator GlrR|nr:sigma-54 dependent transcriptional regulator [Blastocatellia bacterium]
MNQPRVLVISKPDNDRLTHKLKEKHGLKRLVGESQAFLAEMNKIPRIAGCDATVLISGETGTGKELTARAIHYLSSRADKPFVPVNCGAIPIELAENELFGHERGAFTGAWERHPGLIGEAHGGTLFLDELDCLPLLAQVKLLRFLQEKEYRALGSSKAYKADVRIITSANIDFEEAMKTGKVRPDLYYRLNVLSLRLPPLRERRQDIPLLARYFLARYAAEFAKAPLELSGDLLQRLMAYDWPGNVRELQHTIERAVAISDGPVIQDADLPLPGAAPIRGPESFQEAKARAIAEFERGYIEGVLKIADGNITRAAKAARKNRRSLRLLIRKHKIDVNAFRPDAK